MHSEIYCTTSNTCIKSLHNVNIFTIYTYTNYWDPDRTQWALPVTLDLNTNFILLNKNLMVTLCFYNEHYYCGFKFNLIFQ